MKNAAGAGADTMIYLKRQQELLASLKAIDGLTLMKG
jgi:hypothetical protein